jgi:hypothetical protein
VNLYNEKLFFVFKKLVDRGKILLTKQNLYVYKNHQALREIDRIKNVEVFKRQANFLTLNVFMKLS